VREKVGDQRIGNGLRAADGDRPPHGVAERREHQPCTRGHQRRHLRNRVRGNTTEQRLGIGTLEHPPQRGALLEQPGADA
jgi:hypothetical protein